MISLGIVGGGASGMAAALFAARNGAKVTILEGNDRVGKKILSTGNGKCNLSNLEMDDSKFYSSCHEKFSSYLNRFTVDDVLSFFHSLGLFTISKNGYLYPKSEQAASVLDVLRYAIDRNPLIQVKLNCKINRIEINKDNKKINLWDQKVKFTFDRVILACGSKAAPKTGSDGSGYQLAKSLGHSLVPVVPALVQLRCEENWFKAVAGVRADAMITVKIKNRLLQERGELQLTDYGISGIPVFQLSREVNYILENSKRVEASIDFFPDLSLEQLKAEIEKSRGSLSDYETVEQYFTGVLNKKLMTAVEKIAGIKLSENPKEVGKKRLMKVSELCKDLKIHIVGSNSFEQAQVCAGGVNLNELDCNLQSKLAENVFMIGEMVDVDGRCGGYNLHWAWCSGAIAGTGASH